MKVRFDHTYGHSGSDYRFAKLSKSYLPTKENHEVKSDIDTTILTCLIKRKELSVIDGWPQL